MGYNIDWVTAKFDNGDNLKFIFFWGHSSGNATIGKHIFSQWYPSSFRVDNIEYKTAEHWMMAHKALLFQDRASFNKIIQSSKAAEAKELGRQIHGFDEAVWDKVKFELVKLGSIHKFNQNPELKNFLLATENRIIVEASPTDTIWGIGLSQDSKQIENPHTWRGQNLLGFALMEARDFLGASKNL